MLLKLQIFIAIHLRSTSKFRARKYFNRLFVLYHLTVLVHAKAKIHLGVVGKRWIFTISTTSHLIGKCLLNIQNIDYDHKKGLDFLNYLILLVCLHAIKNIIYIVNVAG